jgi:hypothetical protein
MRPLPLLGLIAGLAMLGWGGYSLYARCTGPEVYWGRQKEVELGELTDNDDSMRRQFARHEAWMLEYREKVAAMPAGPPKDAEARDLDDVVRILAKREKEVKEHEFLLGTRLNERDVAKTLALVRGISFPLLGLVCVGVAGRALFTPGKRAPATATPAPLPPSPRPGG